MREDEYEWEKAEERWARRSVGENKRDKDETGRSDNVSYRGDVGVSRALTG